MERNDKSLAEQVSQVLEAEQSLVFSDPTGANFEGALDDLEKSIRMAQDGQERAAALLDSNFQMGYGATYATVESDYSAEVERMREELEDSVAELKELYAQNAAILEEVLDTRGKVASGISKLFATLDESQQNVQTEIDAHHAKLDPKGHDDLSQKMDVLQTKLNKIKHDRCIFFGCIDVHPPDLDEAEYIP